MTGHSPGPQDVCLLLADLSGYTEYVAASEPEHAPTMAGDLVEAVVRQLRPAFRLEKLEGDAAFLLAPLRDLDGTQVLDAIDAAYDAFSRRVESLRQGTTCDCESCRRVPDLDLKFIVHAGTVTRHTVAGRQEVGGTDAILAHRLLKASTPAALGLSRYVLLTNACLSRLGVDINALAGQAAIESFEYLGEVPVRILPLGANPSRSGWSAPANRRPLAETELELSAPPMTVWDELTSPSRRPGWEGELQLEENDPRGRRGVGTMTTCVANRLGAVEEILEWRPFDGFVRRAKIDGIGRVTAEHRLSPSPDGARTQLRARWFGPPAAREIASDQAARLSILAKHLEVAHADR
jgi:class 3 adenylate cyclase